MKVLQIEELREWFDESPTGIQIDSIGHLRYRTSSALGIRLDVPAEPRRIVSLAHSIITTEHDVGFSGAVLFFKDWGYSPPHIENCALKILEQMRRGYGVTASLENAPAQLFRSDEIADAQAFLAIPLLFGWDTYFMPYGTRYFAFVRENGSLFLISDDEKVIQKLLTSLESYHPVRELPSYLRGVPAR